MWPYGDRKSTRLNSSHVRISYAVFCLNLSVDPTPYTLSLHDALPILDQNLYPWGGLYTRNDQGCFLANFKPLRGRYADDGGLRTMTVGSFAPNDFGLYDMAGNVAEWTASAFDESSYTFMHDLNPTYK